MSHQETAITMQLQNRVALVTGGSRGIGKAIAFALASAGAAVAVNYRERERDAIAVAEAIQREGGRAIAIAADVSISAAVSHIVSEIERRLGPIDILVNNAGVAPRRGLFEITESDFDQTLAINLKSAFLCTHAVLQGMRAQHWGRIVNISSIAGRAARADTDISVAYNASKAGLEGLTRGYAARLASEGITVNAIAPGLIDTDMGRLMDPVEIANIPVGRSGTGEEIAQAVLMLVNNAFITGQTIAVNGGKLLL